jgi:signal transduction histidine kinase/FixJ family two-component response regulator
MPNHNSQSRKAARFGAFSLVLLGSAVLAGWALDLELLKSILPGGISMKPNAAIGFICAGIALVSLLTCKVTRVHRCLAAIFSLALLVVGLSTCLEYFFHVNLKIDQWIFPDYTQSPYPGRMPHITAVNFCIAGTALLLLCRQRSSGVKLAQLLAVFTSLNALFAIIGYVYGVPFLYGSLHYASMTLHTGVGFLVLAVLILVHSPHEGFVSVLTSSRPAGWLTRKLLSAAVACPFILGLLAVHSSKLIADMRFMVAAMVIAQILLFAGLIWISVSRLNQSQQEEEVTREALARSEQMLRQSQKMEAIGLLAGGVAHDFNNLLNVILGYSELLLTDSSVSDTHRSKIEKIRKAGDTASGLTRQLLAFSRRQVLQPKVLDLNQIIGNPDGFLQRLVKEDISFTTSLDAGLMATVADPTQVEQIFLNLVINACDAMPSGGKLHIETANVVLEQPFTLQMGVAPGAFVRLTITDTGTGMDDETRAHIFEPFYTTKAVGKGTGLGLATVYGIVKQSGGYIEVDSKLGRGTTFQVYLPASRAPLSKPPVAATHIEGGNSATILVVEDSAPLRDLIFETLESMGYTALLAQDGQQAIRMCTQFNGTIDVLLSDVIMPRMNGPEVMRKVKQIRPDIGVVFMSGYTNDVTIRHGISSADVSFIQKPFSSTELTHKVREALVRAHDRNTIRQRLGLEMQKRSDPLRANRS